MFSDLVKPLHSLYMIPEFLTSTKHRFLARTMPLFGGSAKPSVCRTIVLGHTTAVSVHACQPVLTIGVSLFCRLAEPFHGLRIVTRDASSLSIQITKTDLCGHISSFSVCVIRPYGLTVPLGGLLDISVNPGAAQSNSIDITKPDLREDISSFSVYAIRLYGLEVPVGGFDVALRYSRSPFFANPAHEFLSVAESMFCRLPIPLECFRLIRRHALAEVISASKIVLRIGITSFGERAHLVR
jgi:hypothetical protein